MAEEATLGVIGGSGLYSMAGFEDQAERELETPFGKPSSPLVVGSLKDQKVAFLARHGRGHVIQPSEVNYRANIYALKMLGVQQVIAVSACGSLREDYAPGDVVIPNQLFDFTKSRPNSFFGQGLVAHVSVADPFCSGLSIRLTNSVASAGGTVHQGGAFVTVEGPRFSTRAESNIFRAWGMSIIGMTTAPEAFLAREAEMCYAVMAHVTDYDVWHVTEDPVTVEKVFEILEKNTELAQTALGNLAADLPARHDCECRNALKDALTTHPDVISEEAREKVALLVDRYLS